MNISLGNYYPGDSLLHRLDPRLKFVAALFFMILLFFLNTPVGMGLFTLFTVLLIAVSRVPARVVLRSLRSIVFIGLFAFVINIFTIPGTDWLRLGPLAITDQGVYTGLRMALRLILLITMSTLFLTLTTTPLLIADAIESLLKPLARIGFPSHELAMMMSIALRFIPTLIEETDKIMKAQSSRGADYDSGRFLSRVRGLVSILIPLFVNSFKRADDLALAMEARCYRGGEGRTKMRQLRYARRDGITALVLVFSAAIMILAELFIGR